MLRVWVVGGRRHGVVFFGAVGHVQDVCVAAYWYGMGWSGCC